MVRTVNERSINLHVEGNTSLNFILFLLISLLYYSSVLALSKQLLDSLVLSDLTETILGLLNKSESESSKADLSHSSVVKNLSGDILSLDKLLYVSLE